MEDNDTMSSSPETAEGENFKILIDSETSFKGRVTKPTVVSFKYKDLADALSEASGLTVNRAKAKAMFSAFRRSMGL